MARPETNVWNKLQNIDELNANEKQRLFSEMTTDWVHGASSEELEETTVEQFKVLLSEYPILEDNVIEKILSIFKEYVQEYEDEHAHAMNQEGGRKKKNRKTKTKSSRKQKKSKKTHKKRRNH
jgi:hypothetical protein